MRNTFLSSHLEQWLSVLLRLFHYHFSQEFTNIAKKQLKCFPLSFSLIFWDGRRTVLPKQTWFSTYAKAFATSMYWSLKIPILSINNLVFWCHGQCTCCYFEPLQCPVSPAQHQFSTRSSSGTAGLQGLMKPECLGPNSCRKNLEGVHVSSLSYKDCF